jgi:hypothetical protein
MLSFSDPEHHDPVMGSERRDANPGGVTSQAENEFPLPCAPRMTPELRRGDQTVKPIPRKFSTDRRAAARQAS